MKMVVKERAISLTISLGILCSVVFAGNQPCEAANGPEIWIGDVLENTPIGTVLSQVQIIGSNQEIRLEAEDSEYLHFDPSSRNITLIRALNTDTNHPQSIHFTITCSTKSNDSVPLTVPIPVAVILIDYNNNAPIFTMESYNVTVSEDTLVGTTVYTKISATDNDQVSSDNSRILYQIVRNVGNWDYFQIDQPTRSDITLAKKLDYENVTVMTVLIEAKDNPGQNQGPQRSSTTTLVVFVQDVDDQNPVFSANSYSGFIREDALSLQGSIASVTPRIFAWDPDTMNVSIVYRMLDPYKIFSINSTTAVVYTLGQLYVDVPPIVTVVILASQIDNPEREWFSVLSVAVIKSNVTAPRFLQQVYQVTKTEQEPVGSTLISISASDNNLGSFINYSIVGNTEDFSIDEKGTIILKQALDYEKEHNHSIIVTASDGNSVATATVELTILDVNDNNPVLQTDGIEFHAKRENGAVVTQVKAFDADIGNTLHFELRSYTTLFHINANGEITVIADPLQLTDDSYYVMVTVLDNGVPSRESSTQIVVLFPPLGYTSTIQPPSITTATAISSSSPSSSSITTTAAPIPAKAAASVAAEDSMLAIILGAVAGVLLVIILILIIYIVWRSKRANSEFDQARERKDQTDKSHRSAESADFSPKMEFSYPDDMNAVSHYETVTRVKQKQLFPVSAKSNTRYAQSSESSETERDIGEIEIDHAVVPYDEDFGYHSERPELASKLRTFHGDDSSSTKSSNSDSTKGSQRGLVNGNENVSGNKIITWDSDDKIHPQGAELLGSKAGSVPRVKKERPEITVYF